MNLFKWTISGFHILLRFLFYSVRRVCLRRTKSTIFGEMFRENGEQDVNTKERDEKLTNSI